MLHLKVFFKRMAFTPFFTLQGPSNLYLTPIRMCHHHSKGNTPIHFFLCASIPIYQIQLKNIPWQQHYNRRTIPSFHAR